MKLAVAAFAVLTITLAEPVAAEGLKCLYESCSPAEACHSYNLDGNQLDPSAGNEYLFNISDNWTKTGSGYVLDRARFSGESAMSRTILTISIDTASHRMRTQLQADLVGGKRSNLVAEGQCEIVKTIPLAF